MIGKGGEGRYYEGGEGRGEEVCVSDREGEG